MAKRYPLKGRQAASRGARALGAALLLCLAPGAAARVFAQAASPASVAGRIREGERGVPGISVALISTEPAQRYRTVARGKTDADGRFLIQNVPAGRYQIMPYAPVYVVRGLPDNSFPPGRPLTLLPGDEVKDLDFQVERGGVITGRVTDADGAPVVAEPIFAAPESIGGTQPMRGGFDMRDQMTDDRGVYRIYGLAPGRYRVSAGHAGENLGTISFGRRKIFQRTFYPGTTEEAQARFVEVKAGEEAENVDIALGRPVKTYKASGRFISVETGLPVPNVGFAYGALDASGRRTGSFGGGQATNARGEFQTEGLAPGRYALFTMPGPQESTEFYAEATPFEVNDADVSGIVVRLKRGASVSGVVAIEGVSDRRALARMLSQIRIFGFVEPAGGRQQMAPTFGSRPPAVGPDGSFRLTGLRAGKLRLSASADGERGLTLARVELNGANVVSGGIDLAEGAQLAGARLVMTYGTSVIIGQISYVEGAPLPGSRVIAQARRAGAAPGSGGEFARSVEVDVRGFFRIEGLPAGEYEVVVHVFGAGGRPARSPAAQVSLAEGGEARVAPVVNFSVNPAKPQD